MFSTLLASFLITYFVSLFVVVALQPERNRISVSDWFTPLMLVVGQFLPRAFLGLVTVLIVFLLFF
jgi:hypothetical protein